MVITRAATESSWQRDVSGAEDEIDWDDEEKAVESAPAPAVPVGKPTESAPTAASKNEGVPTGEKPEENAPSNPVEQHKENIESEATAENQSEEKKETEPPKQDFSAGVAATDAEKEAERRAACAKKFGIVEDGEAKKLAERAKKFGTDVKDTVIKGLDSALPERRPKRGREDRRQGGRDAKRQTPDRRTEPRQQGKSKSTVPPVKKPADRITDDPAEKAKAEARAKKFGIVASGDQWIYSLCDHHDHYNS